MNTLALHRSHWLATLLGMLRRVGASKPRRRPSKPVVRIAGLR